MKVLRRIAAAPFLALGVVFSLVGIFLSRVGYIMIGGIDPLGSEYPVECSIDDSPRNTDTTARIRSDG